MSYFPTIILSGLGIHIALADDSPAPPRDADYRLVWSDDFNQDGPPDAAKWRSEVGFARNQELQWYQPDNSRCQGGFLIIEARQEKVKNPNHDEGSRDWKKERPEAHYTSGSLITIGENHWHFGRSEVRARFKALPGLWPAIWTTGLGRWPHSGEIDIMEFYQEKILANFVWAGKGGRDHWNTSAHPIEKFGRETWDGKFHLWVTEWDQEKITIYLDGQLLNTLPMKTAVNADGPAINPFLSPQRFRLNLAIGGNGGDPSKTPFPQRYEVDYVRIYQKKTAQ
jgi:beta-glucanase (GH16 family)